VKDQDQVLSGVRQSNHRSISKPSTQPARPQPTWTSAPVERRGEHQRQVGCDGAS
jgi:hypothetical protein